MCHDFRIPAGLLFHYSLGLVKSVTTCSMVPFVRNTLSIIVTFLLKKNALILVCIMVLVGSDESTAGEEKLRVSLWETESLTTFPMYPTAFFQTEASMGFRAAIYAWHVQW
jgi:hypothetical protein